MGFWRRIRRDRAQPACRIEPLEFIDDSGLGLLVGSVRRIAQQGETLIPRNPSPQIRRVLEVTGVERVPGLTIEPG